MAEAFALTTLTIGNAVLASHLWMRGRSPERKVLATLAGMPVLILVSTLLLGSLGILNVYAVAALQVVVGIILVWLVRARRVHSVPSGLINSRPTWEVGGRSFAALLPIALLIAGVAPVIVRNILTGPRMSWDDYSYHATFPAQWLIDQAFSLAAFNYHAYYPFNSETLSLWWMIPLRADAMVGLAGVIWLALLVAAGTTILRSLGCRWRWAYLGPAVVVASPVVALAASRFSATDLAGPAALLGAVAFLTQDSQKEGGWWRRADLVYAGLLAGFAAGTKVSLAPGSLLILVVIAVRSGGGGGLARLRSLSLAALPAAVTGCYWYIRNMIVTGNPLFPAEVGMFDGPFLAGLQSRTKLISWILERPLDTGLWGNVLSALGDWPFWLVLPGLLAPLLLLLWSRAVRGEEHPSPRFTLKLLVGAGALLLIMFPFVPFSGTNNSPEALLVPEPRHLIFTFSAWTIASVAMLSRIGRPALHLMILAGLVGAAVAFESSLLSVAGAGVFALMLPLRSVHRARRTAIPIIVVFVSLAVTIASPRAQRSLDKRVFSYVRKGIPLGRIWAALEDLPGGSRPGASGPGADQYYPLFGRRLTLRPVALDSRGGRLEPLHVLWERDRTLARWWPKDAGKESAITAADLQASPATHLVVTSEEAERASGQIAILRDLSGATLMYEDGFSSLWRLPGTPP